MKGGSVSLSDVVTVQPGFAFDAANFGKKGDLPLIRVRDVARGFSETFYSGEYDPAYLVKDGDLLISMDGEFRVGRWKGGKALLNQRVCRIVAQPEVMDSGYLFHFLPKKLKRIEDATSYATVKHLSGGKITAIKLVLPPLSEQRRIAAILDKSDAIWRKTEDRGMVGFKLATAVFFDLFGDPVRNSKHWPCVKVEEFCRLVRGSSPRPKGDPRYYGGAVPRLMVADLTRDGWFVTPRIDTLTVEGSKLSRPVTKGTVVMAVSGNVGVVGQLLIDACVHDGFVAFTELDVSRVRANYLMVCLEFFKWTHASRKAGAIFQNLTTNDIKTLEVPLPPIHLQERFDERMINAVRIGNKLKQASDTWSRERDRIAAAILDGDTGG